MKNKTTKQGCAGKSSNNGFKTPTFQRVKGSKGNPIRGVWIRGKQFYARLFIDNGSGQKIDRRVPLEAKTVQDARRELEQLKFLGKTSNLSIRQSQPFNSFRDHYLDSIANMKRKRTSDVNFSPENGITPLANAVIREDKESAKLLISSGADVNSKDREGFTPLDTANDIVTSKAALKEITDLLRKHGGKTGEELKAEGK